MAKPETTTTPAKLDKFGEYIVIPLSDRQKVRAIGTGLQDYWLDCWETDPFGTRWVLLPDDATNTTKAKYRQQLTKLGLFLFEKRGTTGNWSVWCLNLRGSRIHLSGKVLKRHFDEYGVPQVPMDTINFLNSLLDINEESLDSAEEKLDGIAEKLDGIEQKNAETLTQSGSVSLSVTPQYSLNNSSQEVLREKRETPRPVGACVPKREERGSGGFNQSGEFVGNSPARVEEITATVEAIEQEMISPEYQRIKLEEARKVREILKNKRPLPTYNPKEIDKAAYQEEQIKLAQLWKSKLSGEDQGFRRVDEIINDSLNGGSNHG